MKKKRKSKNIQPISDEVLLKQIKELNRMISCNNIWFEGEKDKALIESCIYQRGALMGQYRYLLKCAKERNIKCDPFDKTV